MHALIGIAVVFAAVIGGFLLESGNLYVLLQPAELLIVGGAAAGIVMVANPPSTILGMWRGVLAAFRPPPHNPKTFLRYMRMLYEVFAYIQRVGILEIENDVEDPAKSRLFANHPDFLKDKTTRAFVCDSLRMLVVGVTTASELDQLMELDIEAQRRGRQEPVTALHAVADALPGLGIVAAVLGVVITMQAIGGPPEAVGQKVAAALVGTFLGILLCYGVVGPVATRLQSLGETEGQLLHVLRIAIVAFARGASPILAVEYARRSVAVELRPSFQDMEISIKREAKIPPVRHPNIPEAVVADAQAQSA
ncbi:MAG: chemotaxis protein [Candidatus Solibacter sp.]|jgi:chemotaxis protein MotA|nr:chemotaxis protein [Candidatus Solibacter sp.]